MSDFVYYYVYSDSKKPHLKGDYQETWCRNYYGEWEPDWRNYSKHDASQIEYDIKTNRLCKRCAKIWQTT